MDVVHVEKSSDSSEENAVKYVEKKFVLFEKILIRNHFRLSFLLSFSLSFSLSLLLQLNNKQKIQACI